MRGYLHSLGVTLLAGPAAVLTSAAYAAEGGAGFYLLGSKGPAAAIMAPPGFYLQSDLYFYSGRFDSNVELPVGGRLALGVEGKAVIEMPTLIWVLPQEVLGGHIGLAATLPVGWKETSASASFVGPLGGTGSGSTSDEIFTVGDPVVAGMIGWQTGNFHWQAGVAVNVPIGNYEKGELSNLSFNRWGADVYAAATWLDPAIGLDISGVVGVTFNGENPATRYRTGNEFHFEWAVVQHFNARFDAGIIGYYYDQLTSDSGAGATGPFKGRATAIGGTIGWNFKAGDLPVSTRIKYFHEFDTTNRAEGDAVFLTLTVPLHVTAQKNIAAGK